MHSSSGNIKFTPYSDANAEFDKPFKSLPSRYQENLEISMKRSDLIFESVQLLYCKCHKVSFIHSGSQIGSRRKKWFKNTDDKCFHYTATVLLNYEEIESHSERVSNIKPLINKYNWKGINYPSKTDDWKTFGKNNPVTALDTLYIKEKEIWPAYTSIINLNCEKQIILLMIPNKGREGWHYFAVKKTIYITKKHNIKTSWFFTA